MWSYEWRFAETSTWYPGRKFSTLTEAAERMAKWAKVNAENDTIIECRLSKTELD